MDPGGTAVHATVTGRRRALLVCALLLGATVLGTAGTDLVLPAIPTLPAALGGSAAQAQLVLAAFAAGTALGIVLFGEIGSRGNARLLLLGSIAAYGAASLLAPFAPDLSTLVALRFLQGTVGAAAPVFAPGMIRALFDEEGAMRALGLLGSIESLTPALAPVLGAWLLAIGDWSTSFWLLGGLALLLAIGAFGCRRMFPALPERGDGARVGYGTLLADPVFLRYALSQAGTLGALLIFVFGAPAVIVGALGGELRDFVVMQVAGITTFIVAANVAGPLALRIGAERTIALGSALSLLGALALAGYAFGGGADPGRLPWLFVPMNMGLGLRGPPGFLRAIQAGHGDDARASALVLLMVLGTTAAGTAVVAPFITEGLWPLTLAAALVSSAGLLALAVLPRLEVP